MTRPFLRADMRPDGAQAHPDGIGSRPRPRLPPRPMSSFVQNRRGVLAMLAAMAVFTTSDALE